MTSGDVEREAVEVVERHRQLRLAAVPAVAQLAERAGGRVPEEGAVVRLAVVVAGAAEGQRAEQDEGGAGKGPEELAVVADLRGPERREVRARSRRGGRRRSTPASRGRTPPRTPTTASGQEPPGLVAAEALQQRRSRMTGVVRHRPGGDLGHLSPDAAARRIGAEQARTRFDRSESGIDDGEAPPRAQPPTIPPLIG